MKSNPYYLYGYVDYHIRFFIHNKLLRNKVIKQIDKLDKINFLNIYQLYFRNLNIYGKININYLVLN